MNNENSIKFHTLGVLAHGNAKGRKKEYVLPPIKDWNKEFCDVLNSINYDKDIKFKLNDQDKLESINNSDVIDIFDGFKDNVIILNKFVCNYIKLEFVRFTDTIILKEENIKYAKEAVNSIKQGLSLLQTYNEKREEILNTKLAPFPTKENAEETCNWIKGICALQAHFTADNKRSVIGSDNDIFNELLQNANDRITDGNMEISITDKELILSYKEGGFSGKDFLAISTSGNSGNVDNTGNGNDNMGSTGHKGTGFKSIYNVFNKVVVESGYVKCTLDDTKKVSVKFNGDEIEKINFSDDSNVENKRYFPVPDFEYCDNKTEKTIITLTFKEDEKNKFLSNNLSNNKLDLVEKFEKSKVFLFLDKIHKFILNGKEFNKKKHMKDNYYQYPDSFEITDEELNTNPRWEGKSIQDFKNANKNKVTVLFPKDIGNLPSSTYLYCTLPIKKENLNIPFYINCPAFELEDGRNSISSNNNVEKWNNIIWEKAIKDNRSAFASIFTEFVKDNKQNVIKYFPYNYKDEWKCLNDIPFINTVTDDINKIQLMSINQWYTTYPKNHQNATSEEMKKGFVFLPDYMYKWFTEKNGLDGFKSDIPFVYYDETNDDKTNVKYLKLKLKDNEEIDNVSLNLFQSDSRYVGKLLSNIKGFFYSKYYVDRESLLDINSIEYKFLPTLYNSWKASPCRFVDYQKICYQCFLGKTICERKSFYLDEIEERKISDYNNIKNYKKDIPDTFKPIDEQQFKMCFTDLRTKLYFDKNGVVKPGDEFLNAVLPYDDLDKLSVIHEFSSELDDDKVLTEEQKKKREDLLEKIVVKLGKDKLGNDKYRLFKKDNLWQSTVITNTDFVVKAPNWIKQYVGSLDQEIQKLDFYKEKDIEFLQETVPLYIRSDVKFKYIKDPSKECSVKIIVACTIRNYLQKFNEFTEKERYLFQEICSAEKVIEGNVALKWDKKFFPLLDIYNEKIEVKDKNININTEVRFMFKTEQLSSIPKHIIDKFNDRVDLKEQEKKFRFMETEYELKEIIENKVKISSDKNSNKRNYCIGKYIDKNDENVIIVFGEESIGKMLNDLFDCKGYINPNTYTEMNCFLPNPLFNDEFNSYREYFSKYLEYELKYNDDSDLKTQLLNRLEIKDESGNWLCFKGYGEAKMQKRVCPICGGVLIAEASSCHIRYVQAIKGTHVPMIMCTNCNEAVKYTNNVYLCNEDGNEYENKENILDDLSEKETIKICFDMFAHEKKYFDVKMTLLHRMICIKLLK